MTTITPLLRVKKRIVGPSGVYNIQNEWYGYADEFKYTIGLAGLMGFGVGCCPPELLPADMAPLPGTEDRFSPNYGNYVHLPSASIQCFIPAHYIEVQASGNTNPPTYGTPIIISAAPTGNAVLARPFTDGGSPLAGIFIDKFQGSNTKPDGSGLPNHTNGPGGTPLTGGVFASRPLAWPVSPISKDNGGTDFNSPFSFCNSTALNGAATQPSDNFGGVWALCRTRGAEFHPCPIWLTTQIAYLSLAHAQALLDVNGTPIAGATTNAAWMADAPYAPKGNNNSGTDIDKGSLSFARTNLAGATVAGFAGRSSRGFTGAARLSGAAATEHTTHNGQLSGIVDVNGNQWTIVPGMTSVATGMSAAGYRLLPSSVAWSSISSNANIRSAAGLISLAALSNIADLTDGSVVGKVLRIITVGNTDWVSMGAPSSPTPAAGTVFTASAAHVGASTGVAADVNADDGIWHLDANAWSYLVPHAGGTFHPTTAWAANATRKAMAECGFPRELGVTLTQGSTGTNHFGGDGFYRRLLADTLPRAGGDWFNGALAGVFAVALNNFSAGDGSSGGARAVRLLAA